MADDNVTLSDFAETLLNEKNYSTLTPAMREEMKKDILMRAQEYLMAKTIEKLTDEQTDRFEKLLDTNPDDAKLQEFISSCIEDTPKFIGDSLFQFRQIYLGLA